MSVCNTADDIMIDLPWAQPIIKPLFMTSHGLETQCPSVIDHVRTGASRVSPTCSNAFSLFKHWSWNERMTVFSRLCWSAWAVKRRRRAEVWAFECVLIFPCRCRWSVSDAHSLSLIAQARMATIPDVTVLSADGQQTYSHRHIKTNRACDCCTGPDSSPHTHTHTRAQRHTRTRTHTRAHTDTDTHTQRQTHAHRDTRTRARTQPHTRAHTETHTRTQRHTHTHAHARTQPHTHTHTHTETHTRTQRHTHTHAHARTRAHTQTHTHRDKRTHTETHAHARAHSHTHTHTHARTHARTHTHTHTQRPTHTRMLVFMVYGDSP